jgi:hypothetical protein
LKIVTNHNDRSNTYNKNSTGTGEGFKRDLTNNFGFRHKPGLVSAASMLPGLPGVAAKAVNLGWNVNNKAAVDKLKGSSLVDKTPAKSKTRSFIDSVKDIMKGPTGEVGTVTAGGKTNKVSLDSTDMSALSPMEAARRKEGDMRMANPQNFSMPQQSNMARLHPEIDDGNFKSPTDVASKASNKKQDTNGVMVDGYSARLDTVDFDKTNLDPVAKEKAKEFQKAAIDKGVAANLAVDVKDMTRTPERQAEIQKSGKSWTKVSEHMSGTGIDVSPIDDKDQAGWAAKHELAASLGWSELDPAKDPGHMGLTKAAGTNPKSAYSAFGFFGNVPALSRLDGVPTPKDRPTVAQGIIDQAKDSYGYWY